MAAPGSVTDVTLSPNATSMELAWAALATATAYRVEYQEVTESALTWTLAGTPTAPRLTVPRLKAATAYEFRLQAQNADGAGLWSTYRAVTLAAGSPDRPQNIVVTPGDGTLQVAWDAVAGATGYDVQINVRSTWQPAVSLAAAVRSYTFTDLAYQQRYAIRLRAAKGALHSSYASASGTTMLPAPEIQNIDVVKGLDSLAVSWTSAPAATVYEVQVLDMHDAQVGGSIHTPRTAATLPNLALHTAYTVRIRGQNARGWGEWLRESTHTAVAPPGNVRVVSSSNSLAFAWTAGRGGPYTYEYRYRQHGAADFGTPVGISAAAVNLTALTASTDYDFEVRARVGALESNWVSVAATTSGMSGAVPDPMAAIVEHSALRVAVRNPAGQRIGTGPLTVQNPAWSQRIDQIGTFDCTLYADQAQAEHAVYPNALEIFEPGSPFFLGIYHIIDVNRVPQADGTVRLELNCIEQMRELTEKVMTTAAYAGAGLTHATALAQLQALAPGWTFRPAADPPVNRVLWSEQDENLFGALRRLAELTGTHFYQSGDREVQFVGAFPVSRYRLSAYADGRDPHILRIQEGSLSLRRDGHDVVTRVIPRDGDGRDMHRTNRALPAGFSLQHGRTMLVHDAAETALGLTSATAKTVFLPFSNIRPDAPALLRGAANTMFDRAVLYLRQYQAPVATYAVSVDVARTQRAMPLLARQVRLVFRRDPAHPIDVQVNVLEANLSVADDGTRTYGLTVSTGTVLPPTDNQALANRIDRLQEATALTYAQLHDIIAQGSDNPDVHAILNISIDASSRRIEVSPSGTGTGDSFDGADVMRLITGAMILNKLSSRALTDKVSNADWLAKSEAAGVGDDAVDPALSLDVTSGRARFALSPGNSRVDLTDDDLETMGAVTSVPNPTIALSTPRGKLRWTVNPGGDYAEATRRNVSDLLNLTLTRSGASTSEIEITLESGGQEIDTLDITSANIKNLLMTWRKLSQNGSTISLSGGGGSASIRPASINIFQDATRKDIGIQLFWSASDKVTSFLTRNNLRWLLAAMLEQRISALNNADKTRLRTDAPLHLLLHNVIGVPNSAFRRDPSPPH